MSARVRALRPDGLEFSRPSQPSERVVSGPTRYCHAEPPENPGLSSVRLLLPKPAFASGGARRLIEAQAQAIIPHAEPALSLHGKCGGFGFGEGKFDPPARDAFRDRPIIRLDARRLLAKHRKAAARGSEALDATALAVTPPAQQGRRFDDPEDLIGLFSIWMNSRDWNRS